MRRSVVARDPVYIIGDERKLAEDGQSRERILTVTGSKIALVRESGDRLLNVGDYKYNYQRKRITKTQLLRKSFYIP